MFHSETVNLIIVCETQYQMRLKNLKVGLIASNQELKRGLVVSKRLTEAHIWLIVNLIRTS